MRIAVVGAGIAGLGCARELSARGHELRIFDKARGPGGRTSTRRSEHGGFDHGAQYFTARDPGFAAAAAGWEAAGVVAPWTGRIVGLRAGEASAAPSESVRRVGVPRMSALAGHLAEGLDLSCGVRIAELRSGAGSWELEDEDGQSRGGFDAVVVATPAEQAVPLLAPAPELAQRAASAELAPCLAVMAGWEQRLEVAFDGAFVEDAPLAWVARDSSKPGRGPGERWVLHASAEWSLDHLEQEPSTWSAALLEAFGVALGQRIPEPSHLQGHRWRHARATRPLEPRWLWDPSLRIGACGDWCGGTKVEAAWRSGVGLAGRIEP